MIRHSDRPITPGQVAVMGRDEEEVGKETESGGEDVMREEDGSILQKDRPNSTYELLLKRAVEEGRIGGSSRRRVGGMR